MIFSRIFLLVILMGYAVLGNASGYQVVSDFDDTVKITNVGDRKAAICNTLLSKKVFAAVPKLYQIFNQQDVPISIVSSGIIHMKFLMFDDLRENNIPYSQIFMRRYLAEGTLEFKYSRLIQLMRQHARPLVMIGDDTQLDPDAFAMFRDNYPSQALAIYIRNVTGRQVPPGTRRFYTPYEIAVFEYLDGRISYADLEDMAEEILAVKNVDELFPPYAICPDKESLLVNVLDVSYDRTKLYHTTRKVIDHIVGLCRNRYAK